MRRDEFGHIIEDLSAILRSSEGDEDATGSKYPDLDSILDRHPGVTLETLLSIYSQHGIRRFRAFMKRSLYDSQYELTRRYMRGEGAVKISRSIDTPPIVVVRQLVTWLCFDDEKKPEISRCIKEPPRLLTLPTSARLEAMAPRDAQHLKLRLVADLEHCAAVDPLCSPYADTLRHSIGVEYEELLQRRLHGAGVPFRTEDDLRAEGRAKTPDVWFDVPIGVNGKVVNWIDSKASFCDDEAYIGKDEEQFKGYVNRYGSGMVIYWFGLIDDLNAHPQIYLVDQFPAAGDILQLACI
ncbi:hypothetical protein CYMTET_19594 [Cymbomonas tetramitiformis]|uniref:CDAN1-interacting nuclease 1 n=1 Tax=Cymbomonas tetramitiformis TaxID=36881 RepID=A0AAE0G5S2_9CHLO|nr:hypothetical protein CYMTET_19594 [Cymbomonas tetramitiformis]